MAKKATETSVSTETTKSAKKAVIAEVESSEKEAAPKKRAVRKKATEAKSGDTPVKKPRRRVKLDNGEPGPPAPVMKAFWGVFNPMMVQVAQYDYANEKEAQKAAEDMTEKKKTPHFVQVIKKLV